MRHFVSPVRFGLQVEEFGVTSVEPDQFVVGTVFDDAPVFKHDDVVGQAHGAETVADEDGGFAAREDAESGEDLIFGLRVERAGRLIEDEDTGVANEGAGQRDFLPFAAAQLRAFLKPAAQDSFVAFLFSERIVRTYCAGSLSALLCLRYNLNLSIMQHC